MPEQPWYQQYENLHERVQSLRRQFTSRCGDLAVVPGLVQSQVWDELVARAVHESNWQEGIHVDQGRTQELANHVFDDLADVAGPHLDMDHVLHIHKANVVQLKRKMLPIEDIAAYNLSAAYMAIRWIGEDLGTRVFVAVASSLERAVATLKQSKQGPSQDLIAKMEQVAHNALTLDAPVCMPLTGGVKDATAFMRDLTRLDTDLLMDPMAVDHIHFLHRLVLMGIAAPSQTGTFRKRAVHVGNPTLLFPAPALLPGLMAEFAKKFPLLLPPNVVKYDPVLAAAKVSHRFVRIHPYTDGNGRVSRLLMNLILFGHHPPVYLKADKKGRHRYGQALRRADRGDAKPLGSLIALNLIETYEKLIESTGEAPTN